MLSGLNICLTRSQQVYTEALKNKIFSIHASLFSVYKFSEKKNFEKQGTKTVA